MSGLEEMLQREQHRGLSRVVWSDKNHEGFAPKLLVSERPNIVDCDLLDPHTSLYSSSEERISEGSSSVGSQSLASTRSTSSSMLLTSADSPEAAALCAASENSDSLRWTRFLSENLGAQAALRPFLGAPAEARRGTPGLQSGPPSG